MSNRIGPKKPGKYNVKLQATNIGVHSKRCSSHRTFHGKAQRCVETLGHTGRHANGTARW